MEGQAHRDSCARLSHAKWKPPADRVDPVEILEASNKGRLPELIPVRYGRMIPSPFIFYRGAAAIMAADLARRPFTGSGSRPVWRFVMQWRRITSQVQLVKDTRTFLRY